MTKVFRVIATVVLLVGCSRGPQADAAEFTPVAKTFLAAAVRGDFEQVRSLATDSVAPARIRLLTAADSAFVRKASESIRPISVSKNEAAAIVAYEVAPGAVHNRLEVAFRRVGHRWKVQSIMVPSPM